MKKLWIACATLAATLSISPTNAGVDAFQNLEIKRSWNVASFHRRDVSLRPKPRPNYQFDKKMIVEYWVICASEAASKKLANARLMSFEVAGRIYYDFKTTKTCGQFPKMQLALRHKVSDEPFPGYRFQVFTASVNLGDGVPDYENAYVVEVGKPLT